MDFRQLFIELIEAFLKGVFTRAEVEVRLTREVPIGSISGGQYDLLVNCECALRHINEDDYWTTEGELRYYLDCLQGRRQFNTAERDASLAKK